MKWIEALASVFFHGDEEKLQFCVKTHNDVSGFTPNELIL